MDILVDSSAFPDADTDLIRAAVERTLAEVAGGVTEVSVTLLGDGEMRDLNARYLRHDRTTDVLAFALGDGADVVGDVYLGFEQARRQAREQGVPLREELARLAIHGTLHVAGHDHPEGDERWASPMFELQERILADLLERSGRDAPKASGPSA